MSSKPEHVDMRPWRSLGFVDRSFRFVWKAGVGSFCLGWLLDLWITVTANYKMTAPSGDHQFPWILKGKMLYLTANEIHIANLGRLFMFGFFVAFLSGMQCFIAEKRAKTDRMQAILRNFQPGTDSQTGGG